MHVARALAESDHEVVIIDNLNDYYSPQLKVDRLAQLGFNMIESDHENVSSRYSKLSFYKGDLVDKFFVLSYLNIFSRAGNQQVRGDKIPFIINF